METFTSSIPCDNALQVAKDFVTFAFVRLFAHIGKVASKEYSQFTHKPNMIRLTRFNDICIFRYLMRKR